MSSSILGPLWVLFNSHNNFAKKKKKRYFLSISLTPHFTEEETKAEKKSSFADQGPSESKAMAFSVPEADGPS